MFQPAAVRTLLDLRSIDLDRPATARVRGQAPAAQGQSSLSCRALASADSSSRPCSAPAAIFEVASSASTACPSTASSATAVGRDDGCLSLLGSRDPSSQEPCGLAALDEEHLEDVDEEDVPAILERASTMLFQLKHAWQEEREADLDLYWRGMEEMFGMQLERHSMDALQAAVPHGIDETDVQDTSVPVLTDVQQVEEEEADMVLGSIQQEMEAARRLRAELERQLPEHSSQAVIKPSASSRSGSNSEAAEDERLAILRKELIKLRSQADTGPKTAEAIDEDAWVAEEAPAGLPDLTALHRWMEEDLHSYQLAMGDMYDQIGHSTPQDVCRREVDNKRGRVGRSPPKATTPSKMVKQAEEQLDDMLRELDEIDRIHEDLHRSTLL
mmetsp:Transcript_11171/g.20313  ORF Transcript_11171/g.20313 Transcript_11171/m.20313 type:complete len:386 (-) Transcript_11171:52-1209(-)